MKAVLVLLLCVAAVASAQIDFSDDQRILLTKLIEAQPQGSLLRELLNEYPKLYEMRSGAEPNPNCTEDWCYTAGELLSTKGYPVQEHFVKTDDGFILRMFRTSRNFTQPRPAVLLQHGAVDSADTWVLNTPAQSLPMILADQGFDVWLGNTRGNKYSRNHTKYNPLQKEFWDYSTDEMAQFDLPAEVNYIIQTTKQPKVAYVGHSQGTSEMFANLGDPNKPYCLKDKLTVFIATGPVAYFNASSGFIATLARLGGADLLALIGMHEILPSIPILNQLLYSLCSRTSDQPICELVLGLVTGWDRANFNISRLGIYTAHFMSGDSVKQLQWFTQHIKTGDFKKFDYGPAGNQQKYGQPTPPKYDVSAITTPTAFFYGGKDPLADQRDVERTMRTYNANYVVHNSLTPHYAHMEFTWGVNNGLPNGIYAKYLELIRRYAPKME